MLTGPESWIEYGVVECISKTGIGVVEIPLIVWERRPGARCSRLRRAGFEKGWHCLTAGVRRLHLDVLDVMILVVYPESFVYNVIA